MRKFSQLSYHERHGIHMGLCNQKTVSEIAQALGRPTSTITREIARNSDYIGYLYPGKAHELTQSRRNKNVPKIDKNKELKKYILKHLKIKWSPKSISGRWNRESTDEKITAEAIYQWIYREKYFCDEDGSTIDLRKCLIRARKKRGLKRKPAKSKIKERVSIHDRPNHINQRIEFGHYEGDLIFNSGSQSKNVLTLIERVTRHAIFIRNDNKRSETIIDALIRYLEKKDIIMKSITFDNGSEFADHVKLNAIGIKTYFCDPASPWQKGSCEHLNEMTRRYFPFNMPAAEISEQQVVEANIAINNIPRQILGFMTPQEALGAHIANIGASL